MLRVIIDILLFQWRDRLRNHNLTSTDMDLITSDCPVTAIPMISILPSQTKHGRSEACNLIVAGASQQTRNVHPKLVQCCSSIADAVPKWKQHWVSVSCLLGVDPWLCLQHVAQINKKLNMCNKVGRYVNVCDNTEQLDLLCLIEWLRGPFMLLQCFDDGTTTVTYST